ncbi:MAG TPA: heterodisulfide reductase-related iron-sulfur binding cluster [Blastocatellia bacterium]|jgi:glycolate oxidase iron-sulfur subunit|nr:heterodisulfide reductase-related iron-sulfur binding cluster [Blastocatellia bacterium]
MTNSIASLQISLSAETEKLLGCIHCGLCLPACPTYQQLGNENDSPRGRIFLMRAVAEGRLNADSASFERHIDLCLGCRACETACPAGVRYGSLLESARETILNQKTRRGSTLQKILLKLTLRHVFPYPKRLKLVFAISRLLRDNRLIRFVYGKDLARRVAPKVDFALSLLLTTAPDRETGRREDGETRRLEAFLSPSRPVAQSPSRPVSVFTGCVMEGLFKHVNDATKRVLAANDCSLNDVEAQVCCGALHAHAGDLETARELARRNIDAFERLLATNESATIIINAAGCGALLKEYGELLKDDSRYADRATRFSASVRDVTEFLASGDIRRGAEVNRRVTYDAPCHLYHAQRVTTAPQRVLASIPGLEYRQLEGMQDCCGGAGVYNLSEPEMSESLLADKIAKAKATEAEILVTANPGCHMQLGAGARMFNADCRVAHIVELLDESYRSAGFYGINTGAE